MKEFNVVNILMVLLVGLIGYFIGQKSVEQIDNSGELFINGSNKFLNGIKLDLPEEISTIKQQTDTTLDLLTGYLDTNTGVIYLGFSGKTIGKDDHLFIIDHSQIVPELHEYQFDMEMDSIKLFSHGRFVGKVKYGHSPLDSLLMKDNL